MFSVPAFDVSCEYSCVGDEYFDNTDELCVCFGGSLGFGHCSVLADVVEGIGDRISVDSDVVDCLLAGFIQDLIRDLSTGVK